MNLENIKSDKTDISRDPEDMVDDKSKIFHIAVILGIVIFIVFSIGIIGGWKFAASVLG